MKWWPHIDVNCISAALRASLALRIPSVCSPQRFVKGRTVCRVMYAHIKFVLTLHLVDSMRISIHILDQVGDIQAGSVTIFLAGDALGLRGGGTVKRRRSTYLTRRLLSLAIALRNLALPGDTICSLELFSSGQEESWVETKECKKNRNN